MCMSRPITYCLPAGGGGIGTPDVAANSSKFLGRRLFTISQRTRQRFNSLKSGCPSCCTTVAGCRRVCCIGCGTMPGAGCVDEDDKTSTGVFSDDGDCFLLQPHNTQVNTSSPANVNLAAEQRQNGIQARLILICFIFFSKVGRGGRPPPPPLISII